jgi:AcrR family transcriptional regulator
MAEWLGFSDFERNERRSSSDAPVPRGADAKARQILDGARTIFLRDGFDGASMNDIAREAGVSKGTLYVYFASKEALFTAYVRDDKRRQAEQMASFADAPTLKEALETIGLNVLQAMLAPAHVAQIRTVTAAAAKFPEIGLAFYDAGPAFGHVTVARLLASRAAQEGLDIDDFERAGVYFWNIVQGTLLKRALFCSEQPSAQDIHTAVRTGVAMFLRMYARR